MERWLGTENRALAGGRCDVDFLRARHDSKCDVAHGDALEPYANIRERRVAPRRMRAGTRCFWRMITVRVIRAALRTTFAPPRMNHGEIFSPRGIPPSSF